MRLSFDESSRLVITRLDVTEYEWSLDAACLGIDPDIFFDIRPKIEAKALAICSRCTVHRECLDYAMKEKLPLGIFGRCRPAERRRLRRRS